MSKLNRIRTAIYCAGLFLILFSCAKDPTEIERTPTSTFPLTTDSRWEYSGIRYDIPFNDSSLADTVTKEIYRQIIGTDSLPGIADLIVCDNMVIIQHDDQVDTIMHRQWLKIEDSRLKFFAYDEFQIGGDPDPYIFDDPLILLDFPLTAEKTWNIRTGEFIIEDCRVAGIDYIEIPNAWIYCDVVFSIAIDPISEDTLQSAFKWYTNSGMMRFEVDYGVSMKWDDNGMLLDSVRTLEFWELIDMEILEP